MVTLVPLQNRPESFDLMARWLSHPAVREFYQEPADAQQLQAKFGPRCEPTARVRPCLILEEKTRRPVGYAQYYPLLREEVTRLALDPNGTWGGFDLFIGEPDLWGRGYGHEAGRLLLDRLLTLGATHVLIDCAPDNVRAQHLYAKLGFRRYEAPEKASATDLASRLFLVTSLRPARLRPSD